MKMRMRTFLILFVLAFTAFSLVSMEKVSADSGQAHIADVQFIDMVTFPTGTTFAGTEVGGLSAITYDPFRGVFYALSDDRSDINPARFYTVSINVSSGLGVEFLDVTYLKDMTGNLFASRSLDPEGMALLHPGQFMISSEGGASATPPINPFVNRFNPDGYENKMLTIPDKFLPDGSELFGIRNNLAFESLTVQPDKKAIFTATENALWQDGPKSTLTSESPSRVLMFKLGSGRPGAEYVYMVSPIPFDSIPPGIFADNGLVELIALDNVGTFLAMERSFAVGVGNTIKLFEISTWGATDVSGYESLSGASYTPMSKELVADLADLGIDPDNLEGMAFGPMLDDGRQSLILVSDNNFNPFQTTQFILVAVEFE
ncbi:MAG: PEP-CTERM sorting domain-containing protein [Gammaproteobacteria bacterium]|nr:PEP-CTERM sorting domain-containing protein [Gammaproteobacteria bacterium]